VLYAKAWLKWFDVIEQGAGPLSTRMIELADIGGADTVLDIGTGIGEPALCAAMRLDDNGRVLAIDRGSINDCNRTRSRAGSWCIECRI
jgi:ubiquinone/menaquinone biosynthesis C-methylase UbiE